MCRFLAHLSHDETLLDKLLYQPENSLIMQSHEAKESRYHVNADGFGIAWYKPDIDNEPGIFKSTQPAWNDNNLLHLAKKVTSTCALAHVRASTVGDVNQSNCHPFAYQQYAMVHNGTIHNFNHYKRQLLNTLEDDLFLQLTGNTDSEHLFFLIMHFINQGNDLVTAVKNAFAWVVEAQTNSNDYAKLNIAITDGNTLVATRFSSKNKDHLTLHYNTELIVSNESPAITISSEILDDQKANWLNVPADHYLAVNQKDMQISIEPLF
jgi:ergothioneine biosynthesis protein EgtC